MFRVNRLESLQGKRFGLWGNTALVGDTGLVGILAMRSGRHIALLFVAGEGQRQGVATQLLHAAIKICRSHAPNMSEISMHASPNAVAAYARLGVQAEGAQQLEHGIQSSR